MTEEQILKGVWAAKGDLGLPSNTVMHLDEYTLSERLCLWITQTSLAPTKQRKLVNDWCERLPKSSEVRYLWLTSRVSQQIFDAVCEMSNLEALWIKWSAIKNIDKIVQLKNLKHLHIGSSAQVESIEVLGSQSNLITLETEQLNKISDFSVLSNLKQLQGLGIDGSIWTAQKIDTLEPIKQLSKLKYLTATNSRIKDKSFKPILDLKELIRFDCSWNYPASEFETLKELPNLKHGNIETSLKEIKEKHLGKN